MPRFALLFFCFSCFASQANTLLQPQLEQLWQQGAYADAKALLVPKIDRRTKDAFLLSALGRTELALGDTEQAEQLLNRAVKAEPANAEYQFLYGQANCNGAQKAGMFGALSRAKRCVKAFETAHQLSPETPQYMQALAQFYAQAPGIAGGDKDKALQLAKTLQQYAPLKGQLLELELLLQQNPEQAQALLASSTELQQRPEPYFMQAVGLASKRDYSAAIALFQQATEQPAPDLDAQRSQLMARYQLGRAAVLGKIEQEQGIHALQQFIADGSIADFQEWAQFRLAQLYQATEQPEKANALLLPLQASTKDDALKTEIKKIL
ncbi:tetratricopeptide repeat protein [Arsukibacterium sp.]|uniref:tetratricopeptide repeat protein n=1 Tax=Arsukibacterium sp. TaxID=1977258 RepID=UPI002FDA6D1E